MLKHTIIQSVISSDEFCYSVKIKISILYFKQNIYSVQK